MADDRTSLGPHEGGARVAIPEDLNFDPSHRRQLTLARHLLGLAINRMPIEATQSGALWSVKATREQVKAMALEHGLVAYDDWHPAPACPANNWSRQRLPEGPCTPVVATSAGRQIVVPPSTSSCKHCR